LKWTTNGRHCGSTKVPLTLFLLKQEAQKKKLCKKKMPLRSRRQPQKLISFTLGNPYAARLCYAQGGRFCKSDAKQSRNVQCEQRATKI
jgi:hypothetical protein